MTTGIPNIDYFISSQHQEIANAEQHYSEKLVRLSRMPTFYYKPTFPPLTKQRSDFGLSASAHLYVCPQSLFKIHPDFDRIFAEILHRDPQGCVVLVEGTYQAWTQRLKQRFAQTIPTAQERIYFLPRMTLLDYFNLIALAEVLLDTFPFGGGGTSYEALAIGTPIVTLPTDFMRGRATYACYQQMGVTECIAQSPAQYVEIALRLGTETAYRAEIKAKLLANNAALYADGNIVRELEHFFAKTLSA
jgi:predicted O-linked N-acetylglucosamine transferase (SPINDLY family)